MNPAPIEPAGLRLSFLGLVAHYGRVEIPLLQRDYAQGRTSASVVRDRFLAGLLRALREDKPLNLDFVYGEATGRRGFQPIDGQQRLTALFLLHWFLACAADRAAKFRAAMRDQEDEPRFCYAVRISSHRFFAGLLDHVPPNPADPPAQAIRESAWFFRVWEHDPTIRGALTMLDAIWKKFAGVPGLVGFYGKLTPPGHGALITMDVLSLGDLGLSDEIYVRMNARGKELTGFEKFKAWLIGEHPALRWPDDADDAGQWTVLLDGDWLDLFWRFHQHKPEPAEAVSRAYFRTVVALAINSRASIDDKIDSRWLDGRGDLQEKFWADLLTAPCVRNVLEKLHGLAANGREDGGPVKQIRQHLQAAGVGPFDKKGPPDRVFFEDDQAEVTLGVRVWLHAVCVFLESGTARSGPDELHWFRIVRNLLQNSSLNAENFGSAIKSFSALGRSVAASGSVLRAVADWSSMTGLSAGEFEEERRKARFISQPETGAEWEKLIVAAEAHPVLAGQLEWLLPTEDDPGTFAQRWDVFCRLLDEHGSRLPGGKNEMLLARAALAQSEPIKLNYQERISFADTATNWSELLGRGFRWPQFRDGLRRVIDALTDETGLEPALRKMLEAPRASEPWMHDVVRFGDVLFEDSWYKKVQQYRWDGVFVFHQKNSHENDILLGPKAALRNLLIEKLTGGEQPAWKLGDDSRDWRRLSVGQSPAEVYYKGFRLNLVRAGGSGSGRAVCTVGLHQLGLAVNLDPGPLKIELPYPEDGSVASFQRSLNEASASTSPEMEAVLRELEDACDSASG